MHLNRTEIKLLKEYQNKASWWYLFLITDWLFLQYISGKGYYLSGQEIIHFPAITHTQRSRITRL